MHWKDKGEGVRESSLGQSTSPPWEAQWQLVGEFSQWGDARVHSSSTTAFILGLPEPPLPLPPDSSTYKCKNKSNYKTISNRCWQADTSCSNTTHRPIATGHHLSLASKIMVRKTVLMLHANAPLDQANVTCASDTDGKCCRKWVRLVKEVKKQRKRQQLKARAVLRFSETL